MHITVLLSLSFALGCYPLVVERAPVSISPPASVPSNASPRIPRTFPGFAFDGNSLIAYAGKPGKPNAYSQNLIDAVSSRTGVRPILRVGGTNADRYNYDAQQKAPFKPASGSGGATVGPSFFQVFKNFPDAKYIFQCPLNSTGGATNSAAFADAGLSVITSANLQSVEIGNEPANYAPTVEKYVNLYLKYEDAIVQKATSLPAGPIFQAPDGASKTAATNAVNPVSVFGQGKINANNRINTCAEHYYQARISSASANLQLLLMNHTEITQRLDTYAKYPAYIHKNFPSIAFILSKVGNSLTPGGDGAGPFPNFQTVLGSALWAVDFQLYAMTIGVNRVNMQQKTGAGFSAWQPVETDNYAIGTQAPFYSQPYIADFIAKSGNTRVVQLDLNGGTQPLRSAYAAYDAGTLSRIAIVNLKLWDGTGTRPTQTFAVAVPSGAKATLERLTSANGARAMGDSVSWAGLQWPHSNLGMETGTRKTERVTVKGGMATVTVNASEAVIMYLA